MNAVPGNLTPSTQLTGFATYQELGHSCQDNSAVRNEPNVEDWRIRALEQFPELENEINENTLGPEGLWIDLFDALASAYEERPVNDDLIGRIYDYAAWCFKQPDTDNVEIDLSSATAVGLIENLPLHRNVSDDLYRWLSVESFEGFEALFRYHLSDEEYRKFHCDFIRKKSEYAGPSRL